MTGNCEEGQRTDNNGSNHVKNLKERGSHGKGWELMIVKEDEWGSIKVCTYPSTAALFVKNGYLH